jgi:hypothetical protein
MSAADGIWWLVLVRGLVGGVALVGAARIIGYAYREIGVRRAKNQNGMEELILRSQVQVRWLLFAGLAILSLQAWLVLPVVAFGRYGWRQVAGAVLLLVLTAIFAGAVWIKWHERDVLLRMAARYRKKGAAEGGPRVPPGEVA